MSLDFEGQGRGEPSEGETAPARVESSADRPGARRLAEEALVDRLAALTDSQFVEVFYAAVGRRGLQGLDDWKSHWILAEAEQIGRGPWEIDFIAPAREEVDDPDRVICRETTCPRCRTRLRSWARVAGCPVCGRTVYCN